MAGAEAVGPGDEGHTGVAEIEQMQGRLASAEAVVRDDHVIGVVELHRGDADVFAADVGQQLGRALVLGHRRGQHHAIELLALHEAAHVGQEGGAGAVAGMHHQLKARAAHAVQEAELHVHDILGVGVVVDQPDQERPAEGQAAGLGVRRIAGLGDHRLDALAGFLLHEGRGVDDTRDGLLRHPGQARDVVDRGAPAAALGFRRIVGARTGGGRIGSAQTSAPAAG